MTVPLFAYPKKAAFGRILPKAKIYEYGKPSSSVKKLFVQQVEKIVWQYKLAPGTLNLKASRVVPEIQVFTMVLKVGQVQTEVLRCIDLAIPFPTIFELQFNRKIKPIAAFKRPSEVDPERWIVSEYFETDWVSWDSPRNRLPMAMDLEALYDHLLRPLMPYPARPAEGLQARVARMELIRLRQRELERYEARLRKEKQFNRKVMINAELRKIKQELENVTCPQPTSESQAEL